MFGEKAGKEEFRWFGGPTELYSNSPPPITSCVLFLLEKIKQPKLETQFHSLEGEATNA